MVSVLSFVFWWQGMWDLSSPTRDQTCTPCIGRQSPSHWTTRGVPTKKFLIPSSKDTSPIEPGPHSYDLIYPFFKKFSHLPLITSLRAQSPSTITCGVKPLTYEFGGRHNSVQSTETQKWSDLPKVIQLVSVGGGIQWKLCTRQSLCTSHWGSCTSLILLSCDRIRSVSSHMFPLDAHNILVLCGLVLSQVWLFCDPRDCSPPGFSVHGISQARILE